MRTLEYNNAAYTLRFEFPPNWGAVTAVNITIQSMAGADVLAATAATLPSWGALASATAAGDTTATLASSTTDPADGDWVRFEASTAGPAEDAEVLSFNPETMTLRHPLEHAHASGGTVSPRFCTYDLDTSTVATWTKGLRCTIQWTPNTDDPDMFELAEVAVSQFEVPNFEERFKLLSRQAWMARQQVIPELYSETKSQLHSELQLSGLDLNRVMDTELFSPLMLAAARRLAILGAGSKYEDERTVADVEYQRWMTIVKESPIWTDTDHDEAEDDTEIDDHGAAADMGGRGL